MNIKTLSGDRPKFKRADVAEILSAMSSIADALLSDNAPSCKLPANVVSLSEFKSRQNKRLTPCY